MRHLFICLFLGALPALAQEPDLSPDAGIPMTVADFEAYATGKTLTYSSDGQIYGAEQYLPDRQVRWAFKDETCHDGHWYEEAGNICFVYDYDLVPQCWQFFKTDSGIKAHFLGDDSTTDLSEVNKSDQPLACAGPDVGV